MTDITTKKLALVTGASRGIGAATAEMLAREGWHVIITGRTEAGLAELDDRIHKAGGSTTIALQTDGFVRSWGYGSSPADLGPFSSVTLHDSCETHESS